MITWILDIFGYDGAVSDEIIRKIVFIPNLEGKRLISLENFELNGASPYRTRASSTMERCLGLLSTLRGYDLDIGIHSAEILGVTR